MSRFIQWMVIKIGAAILKSFDFLVDLFVSPKAVFNQKDVEVYGLLFNKLDFIIQEYQSIYSANKLNNIEDFYKVESNIGQDNNWKAFPFKLYNYSFKDNLQQCPQIRQLLESIPSCTSAMISVLFPHKHITPHRGLYKGVIRCLFTIEAPKNGTAWIIINGNKYIFQRGEAVFFDETYLHEVKNESLENRVALYLDIYRQLPFPLNYLNKIIFNLLKYSPFISEKVEGYQKISHSEIINNRELVGYKF